MPQGGVDALARCYPRVLLPAYGEAGPGWAGHRPPESVIASLPWVAMRLPMGRAFIA